MSTSHIRLLRWTRDDLAATTSEENTDYADPFGAGDSRTYERMTWMSAVEHIGFAATSVVSSWTATTPGGTWLEVAVRRDESAPWLVTARWAQSDDEIHRTTVDGQRSDGATVETDEVLVDVDAAWTTVQLRITSLRPSGTRQWPQVRSATLAVSALGPPPAQTTSTATAPSHVLDVPTYSQQLYRDELPEFGGGGQNWCSPTCASMLRAFWDESPWGDRVVPYAATQTYDHAYRGTGNWAFTTAYAGQSGLTAFVTRLRSLTEAEQFTAAGIPLALSVTFTKSELDGAGYDTQGHILVLVGFDEDGDPVVNDPASHRIASDDAVRTTYRRDQLERAWLGGSGGVVYVVHPDGTPLPPPPDEPNW